MAASFEHSFIGQTVDNLFDKYGEKISELKIVLPNKRARFFFNKAIQQRLLDRPIWQPEYLSVDNLCEELSGLKSAGRLRLVAELYKIYSQFHEEPFDKFYFWGEMLLSDFDAIDNHMVAAEKLFVNIVDLKELDLLFDYLLPEQLEVVRRFWTTLQKKDTSSEKQQFLKIWKTLYRIYSLYKERLLQLGFGYGGMIYREAAEKLQNKEAQFNFSATDNIVVVGFNALSKSEKIVFKHLAKNHNTLFYWDADNYYLNDKAQESGWFIRDNIRELGDSSAEFKRDNFSQPKNITIVNAPSDALQSKYVWQFMQQCNQTSIRLKGVAAAVETAVVLTDESMLLPVLYSIPPEIEAFNVTSGYNISLTAAYSLTEYLILLQSNAKQDADGQALYYYKDIISLLNHPYICYLVRGGEHEAVAQFIDNLLKLSRSYIASKELCFDELSTLLFSGVQLSSIDYIISVLEYVLERMGGEGLPKESSEFMAKLLEGVLQVRGSVRECGIELSRGVLLSVLRKHLSTLKVSFEGEPLIGVQVMGILETRNIDFENVLLLSANEANFPGSLGGNSFVPPSLRVGYGMPTFSYHEAMYSYYFYRLLQRARNIHIVYNSSSDKMSVGEPSRFIHQLLLESPHKSRIEKISLALNVNLQNAAESYAIKSERVMAKLTNYLLFKRRLSPSALYIFLACPYRFYLQYIEEVRATEELEEEIGSASFGSIIHAVLQQIYSAIEPTPNHQKALEDCGYLLPNNILPLIDAQVLKVYGLEAASYTPTMRHTIDFIKEYVLAVVRYDRQSSCEFVFKSAEEPVSAEVEFFVEENVPKSVIIAGSIDRVDLLPSGLTRIIDYKSGTPKMVAPSIDALFDRNGKKLSLPMFQTLLYSMLWRKSRGGDVVPSLYYAKNMGEAGYSPLLMVDKQWILRFSDVEAAYQAKIGELLAELFNPQIPFVKCTDDRTCEYCPFVKICKN